VVSIRVLLPQSKRPHFTPIAKPLAVVFISKYACTGGVTVSRAHAFPLIQVNNYRDVAKRRQEGDVRVFLRI
jgi:hypothetical protein